MANLKAVIVSTVVAAFSHELFAQPIEPAVVMTATAAVRAIGYSTREPETVVMFSLSPVTHIPVRLAFGNSTGRDVQIGDVGRRWTEFVSVELLSNDGVPEATGALLQVAEPVTPGSLRIEHNRSPEFRGALVRPDGQAFSTGLHEIRISLASRSLNLAARQQGNLLSSTIRLRITSPRTRNEMSDFYLQQGFAASLEGRPAVSREWASRVLALNQASIPAILDIGSSWLAEGDCARAVPEYQRAIALIESDADRDLAVNNIDREDWVAGLRGKLAVRCGVR